MRKNAHLKSIKERYVDGTAGSWFFSGGLCKNIPTKQLLSTSACNHCSGASHTQFSWHDKMLNKKTLTGYDAWVYLKLS